MAQDRYAYFSLGSPQDGYEIQRKDRNYCLTHNLTYRKARIGVLPNHKNVQTFIDPQFSIDLAEINQGSQNNNRYSLRRIHQIYDATSDFNFFDQQWYQPTHYSNIVNEQQNLPTILSQFIILDKQEFKTRFFTKTINKLGYYQYFIRRNGQYHVQYMDDVIPVEGKKKLPIWGINIKQPWKLLLLKAWIKQKGSLDGVIYAKPYQFIDAFGLPGYRALSIGKQINSLQVSRLPQNAKQMKQKKIHFNEEGYINVGKTRNNQRVRQLGLRKNRAGYKIIPLKLQQQSNLGKSLLKSSINNEQLVYKIQSQLPVSWAGKYSVVGKQLKQIYKPNIHSLNMQKQFLITYNQLGQIFNKFYTAPTYHHKYTGNISQQSIHVQIQQDQKNPYRFFLLEVTQEGNLNLNVQLPAQSVLQVTKDNKTCYRYASIKYFLAKLDPDTDLQTALQRDNLKSGFTFYDGEYVKGYHKSLNRFINLQKGTYYVYVKIQNWSYSNKVNNQTYEQLQSYAINLITNAKIKTFQKIQLSEKHQSIIMRKTLYNQSRNTIRGYLYSGSKDMIVYLSNKFDEFGFGAVAINLHQKAKDVNLALKVHLNQLDKHHLSICKQAHEKAWGQLNLDEPLQFVAKPGSPAIVILEKIRRQKSHSQDFPPQNTIDLFQIAL